MSASTKVADPESAVLRGPGPWKCPHCGLGIVSSTIKKCDCGGHVDIVVETKFPTFYFKENPLGFSRLFYAYGKHVFPDERHWPFLSLLSLRTANINASENSFEASRSLLEAMWTRKSALNARSYEAKALEFMCEYLRWIGDFADPRVAEERWEDVSLIRSFLKQLDEMEKILPDLPAEAGKDMSSTLEETRRELLEQVRTLEKQEVQNKERERRKAEHDAEKLLEQQEQERASRRNRTNYWIILVSSIVISGLVRGAAINSGFFRMVYIASVGTYFVAFWYGVWWLFWGRHK